MQFARPSSLSPQLIFAALTTFGVAALPAFGQCGDHQWVSASDKAATDAFGSAVTASGDMVAVGSPNDDNAEGMNAGAVYVYRKNQSGVFAEHLKLLPAEVVANDLFGCSVAMEGDWLIAGAKFTMFDGTPASGRAYAYRNNAFIPGTVNWELEYSFTPLSPQAGEQFGHSVAVSDDAMVIASPYFDFDDESNAGIVYHYIDEPWGLDFVEAVWMGKDAWDWFLYPPQANSLFGWAVDAAGTYTFAASAPWYDFGGFTDLGAVHATHGTSTVLMPPPANRQSGAQFGYALSMTAHQVIVGAPGHDAAILQDAGAIYVCDFDWDRKEWTVTGPIFAPGGPIAGARFGSSIAAHGEELVVADNAGRVYRFTAIGFNPTHGGGEWQHTGTFQAPAAATDDYAISIGISEDAIVAGDPTHDFAGAADAGAAYVIEDIGFATGGDVCSDAPSIGVSPDQPTVRYGCTSIATVDGAAGCSIATGPDVWFTYLGFPSNAGMYTIDLTGSNFDTVLSVHTGCPGDASNQIACDDDGTGGLASRLTFEVESDVLYYIRISGYQGAHGQFTMTVTREVEVDCPADLAPEGGDGQVGVADLLALLGSWGDCAGQPQPCAADLAPAGGDGAVGVADLLALLGAWGQCP